MTNTMDLDTRIRLAQREAAVLEQFRDLLDEIYPPVSFDYAGSTLNYDPSRVLEQVDPIAFREMFLGYCNDEGIDLDDESEEDEESEDDGEVYCVAHTVCHNCELEVESWSDGDAFDRGGNRLCPNGMDRHVPVGN